MLGIQLFQVGFLLREQRIPQVPGQNLLGGVVAGLRNQIGAPKEVAAVTVHSPPKSANQWKLMLQQAMGVKNL